MKVSHILFESYSDLRKVHDEIVANDIEKDFSTRVNNIQQIASKIGIEKTHPVDIFSILVKNNIPLHIAGGSKAPENAKDVGTWIKYLRNASEEEIVSKLKAFYDMLEETIKAKIDRQEEKKYNKKMKSEYRTLYKSDDWSLFVPLSKEASCHLGSETKWCISARGEDNYFDQYNEKFDIYIIHTKTEKYAIIVDGSNVKEVQYRDNEFRDAVTDEQMSEFAQTIKNDGVDLDKLEELIGAKLPREHIQIKDISSYIEEGYSNEANGKTIQRYTLHVSFVVHGDERIYNTGKFNYSAEFISATSEEKGTLFSSISFNTQTKKLRSVLTMDIIKQMSETKKHRGVMSDEFMNKLNINIGKTLDEYGIGYNEDSLPLMELV